MKNEDQSQQATGREASAMSDLLPGALILTGIYVMSDMRTIEARTTGELVDAIDRLLDLSPTTEVLVTRAMKKVNNGHRWTELELKQLIAGWLAEENVDSLAEEFGCTRYGIRKKITQLRREGVPLPRRKAGNSAGRFNQPWTQEEVEHIGYPAANGTRLHFNQCGEHANNRYSRAEGPAQCGCYGLKGVLLPPPRGIYE